MIYIATGMQATRTLKTHGEQILLLARYPNKCFNPWPARTARKLQQSYRGFHRLKDLRGQQDGSESKGTCHKA